MSPGNDFIDRLFEDSFDKDHELEFIDYIIVRDNMSPGRRDIDRILVAYKRRFGMPDDLGYLEDNIKLRLLTYSIHNKNPGMSWAEALKEAELQIATGIELKGSVSLPDECAGQLSKIEKDESK